MVLSKRLSSQPRITAKHSYKGQSLEGGRGRDGGNDPHALNPCLRPAFLPGHRASSFPWAAPFSIRIPAQPARACGPELVRNERGARVFPADGAPAGRQARAMSAILPLPSGTRTQYLCFQLVGGLVNTTRGISIR